MRNRFNPFAAVLLCAACLHARAASVHTSVNLPDSLTVGDQFHLNVSVLAPHGADIIQPETDTGFGNVAVLGSTADRDSLGESDSVHFSYLLATYVPEPCTIPSLSFAIVHDGSTDTVRTEPIPLPLISVLTSDTVDIKDLKPQHRAGEPSLWWLWSLLALAGVALVGYAAYRVFQQYRKPKAEPPPPPPYDEAMEAFRLLEMENLIRQGLVREYVFRLSEILKRYIGRRFDVHAQEFTTEEVMEWVRQAPIEDAQRGRVEWFFATSDPVKFARFLPDDATLKRMGEEAKRFVHETRPQEQPVEARQSQGGDGGV